MSRPWTVSRSIDACVSGPRRVSSWIMAASALVGSRLAANAGPADNGPTEKASAPSNRSHFSLKVRMPILRSSTDRTAVNGNRLPVQELSSNNSMMTKNNHVWETLRVSGKQKSPPLPEGK